MAEEELIIKGAAGTLHAELSSVAMNASGVKEPLMDTLILRLDGKAIESKMASRGEVCVVLYKSTAFDITGTGQITIASKDFLDRINLHPSDEIITITVKDKDVLIKGKKRTSKLRQTDPRYCEWYQKDIKIEDGMITFKNGTKPSTTVKVKGSEMNTLPEIEKVVNVGVYNFRFTPKKSHGYVGDLSDPSTKPIRQIIEAEVEGPEAKVTLSGGAQELLSVLNDDEWLIGAHTNAPMWFYQKTKKRNICYLIAPMAEREEAE